MTHTDLLRQALDALELQEPAVGCPREREHWKRTAMPTMDALRAALAQPAPAVQVVLRQPNLFAADPAAPAVNCEWTNCPRRVGDVCCNDRPAAPAVREPLTDEQIDALWRAPMSADWEHREFARAIEAHHGIGGGGNG